MEPWWQDAIAVVGIVAALWVLTKVLTCEPCSWVEPDPAPTLKDSVDDLIKVKCRQKHWWNHMSLARYRKACNWLLVSYPKRLGKESYREEFDQVWPAPELNHLGGIVIHPCPSCNREDRGECVNSFKARQLGETDFYCDDPLVVKAMIEEADRGDAYRAEKAVSASCPEGVDPGKYEAYLRGDESEPEGSEAANRIIHNYAQDKSGRGW